MLTDQSRVTYLDNIRNVLVYNVVLLHIISMFTYPSFGPVLDKVGSSRFYEIAVASMSLWKGSNFNILYEREINRKDGTPAYEFELKWKSGLWPVPMP